MDVIEVLMKSLEESQEYLEKALKVLTEEEVSWIPKVNCNSIIFIFWHLVRVEDIWISRILQNRKETYESEGWQGQLGTPAKESGFQYTAKQLQSWPMPKIELLHKYAASVRAKTIKLGGISLRNKTQKYVSLWKIADIVLLRRGKKGTILAPLQYKVELING